MNGRVKFFNEKKGYGFISAEDEKDYFFHTTNVLNLDMLTSDDIVSFNPTNTKKGNQALEVQKI